MKSKTLIFRALLALLTLSLAHPLSAQPGSVDTKADTLVSGTDTINLHAMRTTVLAEMGGGSYTLTIDEPLEGFLGFEVTVVQLNASGVVALTLNSTAASGSEFQASNTATSTFTFTPAIYQVGRFVCMETAASTLKWVKIN